MAGPMIKKAKNSKILFIKFIVVDYSDRFKIPCEDSNSYVSKTLILGHEMAPFVLFVPDPFKCPSSSCPNSGFEQGKMGEIGYKQASYLSGFRYSIEANGLQFAYQFKKVTIVWI
jgi:hypothetical protein